MNQTKMLAVQVMPDGLWSVAGYVGGSRVYLERMEVQDGADRQTVMAELEAIREGLTIP